MVCFKDQDIYVLFSRHAVNKKSKKQKFAKGKNINFESMKFISKCLFCESDMCGDVLKTIKNKR